MALKTKDRYKKGDKVKYYIDYGASPMLAKSKAEKSKEKEGRVSKVTKDFTGKPQYLINHITIPHSSVVGLSEALKEEKKLNQKVFYIHDESGTLMDKVKGYKNALKAVKSKNYSAQLNYEDSGKFVMVYAHIPKGEKLIPSQMSSAMKSQNIKPNKEYVKENIMKEAKYELILMENPAKNWSFVGRVPMSLGYTEKDGSPLKSETMDELQYASNPSMIAKTRSFKSKEDALKAAKKLKISTNKIQIVGENKQQGENTMKITKTQLVELIKEVLQEETEYQKFFKEKLAGRNLGDMSDEEKKAFFADVDKGWKGEKNETLEPVSPAAGNPLKRVKAKKRDQILAQEKVENYVRKLVREELKFVMFNEVPAGLSRKVAKKRILQIGSTNKSL